MLKILVFCILFPSFSTLSYSETLLNRITTLVQTEAAILASIAHPEVPPEKIITTTAPLSQAIGNKQCDDVQFQPQGQRVTGKLTGKVSCLTPNWSFYLSYQVQVFTPVVVTAEPISRGAAIEPSQVKLQEADLSTLKTGYFQSIDEVIGYTARRTLKPNLVVTSYIATPPYLVTKGDWVTIISGSSSIQVTASGEALRSGRYGDQIPVRNLSSKETIRGWVKETGIVTTQKSQL